MAPVYNTMPKCVIIANLYNFCLLHWLYAYALDPAIITRSDIIPFVSEQAFHEDPVMSDVLQKASKSKFLYETFEQSMRQVQSRPFAYIIDEETGYYATAKAMGRVPCEIGSISFANLKVPWTMLMGMEFRYKSEINYGQVKACSL